MSFNKQIFNDWYLQAEKTRDSITNDLNAEDFNWACFKAQQAIEYALKAVLYGNRLPVFGHSVSDLGSRVESMISTLIFNKSCLKLLDRFYIPTRYADALPGGSPFSFYTLDDATQALNCVNTILDQIDQYYNEIISKENENEEAKVGRYES